jgi:site-specific DNA-methyltransferase (adenine-specific)
MAGTEPVGTIHFGDNLEVMRTLEDGVADLIYVDPPFNTGTRQRHDRVRVTRDDDGDRVGFGGRRYATERLTSRAFDDVFDDYIAWLEPRVLEARRLLAATGTLYFHIDYREVHYCKVLLDRVFGRECFLNEIIWAYDYGGRPTRRWPPKHDNILVYVKDADKYFFDAEAVERIPYMSPGLVGAEKASRGKLPTDTWWHTIVPTNGRERTGYPTQKPLGVVRRILQASSRPGDLVLDFCAGSGTTGAAAVELGRRFCLIDNNPEALEVMRHRLGAVEGVAWP